MDAADLLFLASEIPKINILATTPSTAEGQGLPTFLTVTRTGNLMEPLEVDFVMEGSATFEADYELKGFAQTNIADGKFYFPAGLNQAQIEVRVKDDENYEGLEQISLRIKPWIITGSGKTMPPDWYIDSINLQTNYYQSTWDWMPGQAGKITLDLEDNDAPTKPQVTFVVVDEFASENGEDVAILQVNRLGDTTQALDVPYEIEGKAENNLDFAELPGVFSFAAGQRSGTIVIRPNEDQYVEGIEEVALTMVESELYTFGAKSKAQVLIIDNELPIISIAAVDAVAMEEEDFEGDNLANLVVTRTGDYSSDLTVNYLVSGTAKKTDYRPLSGSVLIPAGEITAEIVIQAVEDNDVEGCLLYTSPSPRDS